MSTSQGDPFAWLGLLKWSLSYTDGTSDASETTPMSDEDREFLERVMKEGIIDENARMQTILTEVTEKMSHWKLEAFTDEEAEQVHDLLEELRDIVEQIDYARAFAAMKGLNFLLGCIAERQRMPSSTRMMSLGILATLSQHNPTVQKELLEMGSLRTLSDLFFLEDEKQDESDQNGQMRARIIQAISANVRSLDLAEAVFCQLDQSVRLFELGLGVGSATPPPAVLRKRTLFFLSAIITSDTSTRERVRLFDSCIMWVADHELDDTVEESTELREIALEMVEKILEQKKSVNSLLSKKVSIVATGVRRVAAIRQMDGDDREFAERERELWESIITLFARTVPDQENTSNMLLTTTQSSKASEAIPQ